MKILAIRSITKSTWQLFSCRYVHCLPWAVFTTLSSALLWRYSQPLLIAIDKSIRPFPYHYLFIAFIAYLLTVIFTAAIYLCIAQKNNVLSLIVERFWQILLASILYALCIYIGLYLYIIPGILLMLLLSMYYPLVIIEKQSPITAYFNSIRLITRRWFSSSLFFALIILILLPLVLVGTGITYFFLAHSSSAQYWLMPGWQQHLHDDFQRQLRNIPIMLLLAAYHWAIQILRLFILPFIASAKIRWLRELQQ